MLLLNDDQFMEGIIGGFGWIVAVYFIRQSMNKRKKINIANLGLVTWAIWWYIRKIGMNIYNYRKKMLNIDKKEFTIDTNDNPLFHILFDIVILCIFMVIANFLFPSKTKNSLSIHIIDIKLIIPILILGLFVLFH